MARIDGVNPEEVDEYTRNVLQAQAKTWGAPLLNHLLYARRPSIFHRRRGVAPPSTGDPEVGKHRAGQALVPFRGVHSDQSHRPQESAHPAHSGPRGLESGTRKRKNLAHNAHCVITVESLGLDLVVEGEATKVSDETRLQQIADVYAVQGWHPTVRNRVFYAITVRQAQVRLHTKSTKLFL